MITQSKSEWFTEFKNMWERCHCKEAETELVKASDVEMLISLAEQPKDLMNIKIHIVRSWNKYGGGVSLFRQEHKPTDQEIKALEIAYSEDFDVNRDNDSFGYEYEGHHTIGELLSLRSIEIQVGNDAMTKANLDYDGDDLDEDLDADDVAKAQSQNLRFTRI